MAGGEMMSMFDDLLKIIEELKINQPPKREIWLTTSMPYKDDKGELVIIELDINAMSAFPPFNRSVFYQYQTITGADRVVFMNPMTFDHLKDTLEVSSSFPSNQIVSSIYGIPVFDDKYRQNYFASKERQSDG